MKKNLKVPKFKNEDEERDFWTSLDLTEYFEPKDMVPVSFPNLKPTSKPISIRLPVSLLNRIKEKANGMGIAYQALIKTWLHQAAFGNY